MPWWNAQTHADRRPLLALRGRIKAGLRAWFEKDGFTEVECGALAASPGNEAHLHAFATSRIRADSSAETLYLHTSPEFAAKKLLAAGETKIFDFARVFRNRERGPLHAPEFTMLEWYRAGAPYEAVQDDCLALLRHAADLVVPEESLVEMAVLKGIAAHYVMRRPGAAEHGLEEDVAGEGFVVDEGALASAGVDHQG